MHIAQMIFCLLFFFFFCSTSARACKPRSLHTWPWYTTPPSRPCLTGKSLQSELHSLPSHATYLYHYLPRKERPRSVECLSFLRLCWPHREIWWSGTSAHDFWCILAGSWWLPLHPFNSLVKMRQVSGFICSEQDRCGGLQSKHVLGSCHLSFIAPPSKYAQLNRHGPASIFHIGGAHCWHLADARCTVTSLLDVYIRHWGVLMNLTGLHYQWVLRCDSSGGLPGVSECSRTWEYFYHNQECENIDFTTSVLSLLCSWFTVKTETILPHFHISGWVHAHSVSQSWIYGKCRLTV